jgi:F-type H+-transporting ATPase subunit epsilon
LFGRERPNTYLSSLERAPAVMMLVVDVVEIRAAGVVHTFAVHGGYILQERDMTTIITDAAERPEEINVERARQR